MKKGFIESEWKTLLAWAVGQERGCNDEMELHVIKRNVQIV